MRILNIYRGGQWGTTKNIYIKIHELVGIYILHQFTKKKTLYKLE